MTRAELRSTAYLAGVSGLRMFGLFVVLPVLSLFAASLPGGADPAMIGFALGAYGLAQAVLQIPFGWASDRVGRKPAIAFGLAVFAAGSFLAAWAPDIGWLAAGRTLQGAGAVSAAVMALAADLTRDEVRTRAMALIGITIGGTFAASLVAGPLLGGAIGVRGIFVLTGILALAAIAVVRFGVPDPPASAPRAREEGGRVAIRRVLADPQLLRLDFGIFALHAILMALFVQMPFSLRDAGIEPASHWTVYLPVLVVSVGIVLPLFRSVDRPGRGKAVLTGAIAVLGVGLAILAAAGTSLVAIVAGLGVFFCAFNLLEASLPSMVSRFAPRASRGTAIGVFSGMQYLGMFAGGAGGGLLLKHAGPAAVYGFGAALAALWLVAGATMANPPAPAESTLSIGRT